MSQYLWGPSSSHGEGDGTPLQYSCLENPMDGGAWWVAVHAVAKSRTRLSDFTSLFTFMHWRRKWQPTPVFLPGESQGRGSLVGFCLWGRTESDTTEETWQQQEQQLCFRLLVLILVLDAIVAHKWLCIERFHWCPTCDSTANSVFLDMFSGMKPCLHSP